MTVAGGNGRGGRDWSLAFMPDLTSSDSQFGYFHPVSLSLFLFLHPHLSAKRGRGTWVCLVTANLLLTSSVDDLRTCFNEAHRTFIVLASPFWTGLLHLIGCLDGQRASLTDSVCGAWVTSRDPQPASSRRLCGGRSESVCRHSHFEKFWNLQRFFVSRLKGKEVRERRAIF